MKFLKYMPALLLAAVSMTSCTESVMDEINKDDHNPPVNAVDPKFQITDAITATAYTGWGSNYAWYVASFTEQIFGTGNNQLMKAELRLRTETAASTTYNNEWNGLYANLMNIHQIIDKIENNAQFQGKDDILGMAQTLWVLNFELLTDMHGDIPYSQALQGSDNLQPGLDKQEDIYKDLMARIDKAIALLKSADEAGMDNAGVQDLLFGGDCSKWLGLAYAEKARLLLNTSFRDPSAMVQALAAANEAVALGFEGAELSIFNGVDCDNSWTAYQWSRYYSGACATVVDYMTERNDPRLDVYAVDMFGTGVAYAPAGDEEFAKMTETVGFPAWLDNGAATLHIFSKSELYFIIAEAQATAGQDASAAFKTAIEASFGDYADASGEEFDAADVDDYIAALGAPTLEEVMIQKYIAQARDEQLQTYNDIRRYMAKGNEIITLKNPNNHANGQNQWPLRLPYGNSDVISNPNVAAAFGTGNDAGNYLFTEHIWLFGGSK